MDKTLLETPEDEIDPQKLPIRDLIVLSEMREWMVCFPFCLRSETIMLTSFTG